MKRSKKMFSRLTSFVHNAVEALAPEMTNLEQFRYHWKAVTQFFLDTSDERMSVENTTIPHHIEQMLCVLLQEEKENGTTSHGPSMEFMLQHKILETMQTLGRADCPPGMKRQVLVFFTNLLGKSRQQLLPHVNAHKPVNKLIRCCGEVKAAPTESEEVAFLLQVSSKLKQDSYLVNFFLEKPSSSEGGSASPLTLGMEREREKPEYSLVDSLLSLTKSEDSRVAIKACEGLLLVTSIPEDNSASVIVLYTAFCERMADQLSKLFKSLPAVIDPYEMNQLSATWGFDHSDENMSAFVGKRQMIAFFSWLDYVNQLSVEAHPMVSKALAFAIRERYILTAIEPGLSQASEPCCITVTALLTRCLKLVTSPLLAQEFAAILLGTATDDEEGETEEDASSQQTSTHKIRELLVQRINHISDQMAVETLRLFQALLQLPYQPIMDVLVTDHFTSRNFIDFERAKFIEEMSLLSTKTGLKSSSRSNIAEEQQKTSTDTTEKCEKLENELENESNITSEIISPESGSSSTGRNITNNRVNDEAVDDTLYHTASDSLILDSLDEDNIQLVEPSGVNNTDDSSVTQSLTTENQPQITQIDNENKISKIPNGNVHIIDSIPEGNENIIDTIPEGNENIIDRTPEGNENIIDSTPEGNENIIDSIPEDNGNIIDRTPEGNENIIDTIPEGNENIIDRIPEGNENVIDRIPEGNENTIDSIPEGNENAVDIIPDGNGNIIDRTPHGNTNINEDLDNQKLVPDDKTVSLASFDEPGQPSIKKQQELFSTSENSQVGNITSNASEEDDDIRKLLDSMDDSHSTVSTCPRTLRKKQIEKVVNGFLLVFPEVLRTSEMVGDVGYDSYLRDAHKQCQERSLQSFQYNWPVFPPNTDSETDNASSFYEGDFLHSILKRLQRILDQPYHINLEVTAIISLLCQFQHPYLHEYLMDTADIVKENILTPHRILSKVCQDMKKRASHIPSCQALLLSMRKNLDASTSGELNSIPEESFFQAVIILEEFCKELAAIAFVTATQNENA